MCKMALSQLFTGLAGNMPKKGGVLTPQEQSFVKHYASTNDSVYAAEKAGYSNPPKKGYDVAQRPLIQSAVLKKQVELLNMELLPQAVTRLQRLLIDDRTPAGAAFQAAKYVIDRCLGTDEKPNSKAPHEMTGEELHNVLDGLRAEAARRSKPIIENDAQGVFE